jgi:eukaryotic-like serine/threonine-protein kinase
VVTNPQDPYGYSLFTYDPLGRTPITDPLVDPPIFTPVPPTPEHPPVNTLATLSLVFAFVFAPAGAILGHLGLAKIRRTGERGRDRALVGIGLSYTFIAVAVLALVGWVTLAESAGNKTAAPATTTAPPTIPPDAIATLLPGLDELKNITVDQNLEVGQTWDHPSRSDREGTIDRPECWGSVAPGTPDAYSTDTIVGYHAAEFSDTRSLLKSVEVTQAIAAFRDPSAAQSQLTELLSGWGDCGGRTVSVTIPGGQAIPFSLSVPTDAGNGITTMDLAPNGLQVRSVRALAAKANVVIDLYVSNSGTTDSDPPRQSAISIATYILNKLPG